MKGDPALSPARGTLATRPCRCLVRALEQPWRVASYSVTDALGLWLTFALVSGGRPGGGRAGGGGSSPEVLELSTGASLWVASTVTGAVASFADHLDDPLPHSVPGELRTLDGAALRRVTTSGARLELVLGDLELALWPRAGQAASAYEWLIDDVLHVVGPEGTRLEHLDGTPVGADHC